MQHPERVLGRVLDSSPLASTEATLVWGVRLWSLPDRGGTDDARTAF